MNANFVKIAISRSETAGASVRENLLNNNLFARGRSDWQSFLMSFRQTRNASSSFAKIHTLTHTQKTDSGLAAGTRQCCNCALVPSAPVSEASRAAALVLLVAARLFSALVWIALLTRLPHSMRSVLASRVEFSAVQISRAPCAISAATVFDCEFDSRNRTSAARPRT